MKTVILIFSVVISLSAFSQKAMTFQKAAQEGVKIGNLDSVYMSGVHSDRSLMVFKSNTNEFIESYYQMLRDFGKFLGNNDFKWETQTKCFNRIYFNKDGKVDYFLYNFNSELSDEMKARFDILLNEFIKDYQFPMSAEVPFSQCSPVTYSPK